MQDTRTAISLPPSSRPPTTLSSPSKPRMPGPAPARSSSPSLTLLRPRTRAPTTSLESRRRRLAAVDSTSITSRRTSMPTRPGGPSRSSRRLTERPRLSLETATLSPHSLARAERPSSTTSAVLPASSWSSNRTLRRARSACGSPSVKYCYRLPNKFARAIAACALKLSVRAPHV
jgi:hypothetical protein